jgi:hypothetical protein
MALRVLPTPERLRSFIVAVVDDARAPAAVRNQCHRLLFAIDANNHTLIEESLARLTDVANESSYALPLLVRAGDEDVDDND